MLCKHQEVKSSTKMGLLRAAARTGALALVALLVTTSAFADVSLTDRRAFSKQAKNGAVAPLGTGSQALIDASGFQWFINDDITFQTTSSASGAASEASYTHAVAATTSAGGTTSSTLSDAFDGYNTLCVSTDGASGPCVTGGGGVAPIAGGTYTFYNINGPSSRDTGCADSRQIVFNTQTIGNLSVYRKVFVPLNDSFGRWLNIITNNGATTENVTVTIMNNLGSDNNTMIFGSSSGNTIAELTDKWVGTMQNFSGNTSSDPRLAHVLWGAGAATGLSAINFADGDDNPYWSYNFSLAPGETKIIMNFAVAQPTKAAATAKANELAALTNANALTCMSTTDQARVANFSIQKQAKINVPTMNQYGMVIFVVLSGLAAIFFLRRQKARV